MNQKKKINFFFFFEKIDLGKKTQKIKEIEKQFMN